MSVDDGIARGCARWDPPAGWEAASPYADGSDAVFVAKKGDFDPTERPPPKAKGGEF